MKYKRKILDQTQQMKQQCDAVIERGIKKGEMTPEKIVYIMAQMIHATKTLENIVSLEKNDSQFDRIKSDVVNRVQTIHNKATLVKNGLEKSTLSRDQTIRLLRGAESHISNIQNSVEPLDRDLGFS